MIHFNNSLATHLETNCLENVTTWNFKSCVYTTQRIIVDSSDVIFETADPVAPGTLPHTEEPRAGAGARQGDTAPLCGHYYGASDNGEHGDQ